MAGTLAPAIFQQFGDDNLNPANGYLLFTYAAGTTTKLATYSHSDLASIHANTNPIVLSSSGRCKMYLLPSAYDFKLALPTDTDPPTGTVQFYENIMAVPGSAANVDSPGTSGEALAAAKCVYMSKGDGGRTAGRWYMADADLAYASRDAEAIAFTLSAMDAGVAGTFRVSGQVPGLTALTVGSTYYVSATAGEITASTSGLAYQRRVGTADSALTLNLSQWLPPVSPVLETFVTTVGNVGTGEDILATYTVPAATQYMDEQVLKIFFRGATANNANAKTLRLRAIEGANNNVLVSMAPTVSEAGIWLLGAILTRTAATTALNSAQAACGPINAASTMAVTGGTAPTLTWANSIEIRLTGEATANNDITMVYGRISREDA